MSRVRLVLAALAVAAVVGACTAGPSTGATACPGFYLRVINQSSGRINVDINNSPIVVLGPSDQKVIGEFVAPQPPSMPWTVDITRSTDGAELGNAHFFGGPNRDLFVTDRGLDEKSFAPPTPSC